ncbi:MAG TPA: citryl-CoA lyase [Trebonia sp.]
MTAGELATAIAHPTADRVVVRGFDLSRDLIGTTTASEYFYVLLTGKRPTAQQAGMLDACIVALAEHGLVPSVQAARMTYASSPEALHGAVAAGLLGAGSVILGSSEDTAVFLDEIVGGAAERGVSVQEAALGAVRERRAARTTIPGVGHPLHRKRDPRAEALLAYGERLGTNGRYVAALTAMVAAVPEVYGRSFVLNVSGVIPAVLMDVGFPRDAMKGVPLIGRTMSLVAHLVEEREAPIGFGLSDAGEAAVRYSGPEPA